MKAAGFDTPDIDSHPIINKTFDRNTYSYGAAKIIRSYIEANEKEYAPEAAAWFEELQSLDDDGRYYFFSSRMIFIARKPG